jgi:hypothetical protein
VNLVKGPGGYFDKIYEYSKSYKKKVYVSGGTTKTPAKDKDGNVIPGKFTTTKPVYSVKTVTRDLGTKELLYLLMGETNCEILADILEVSKGDAFIDVLNLTDEDRILEFFKFLLDHVDIFEVITTLKDKDCPIDPCSLAEEDVKKEVTAVLNNLCSIINPAVGIPAIPMDFLMSKLGISALINAGIKQQFAFLKQKYYDFLGNPPYCKCGGGIMSGPVMNYPPPAPNQRHFGMYNSLQTRLRPALIKQGVGAESFDTIYGNFAKNVLFRGTSPGTIDTCINKGQTPVVPFWPYDHVDFKFGGTLDEECTDEPFSDTYNLIFKKGFDLTSEYMETVGKYAAEVQSRLVTQEQNIANERRNRKSTEKGEEANTNPCCKYNPDDSLGVAVDIYNQVDGGWDEQQLYYILPNLTPAERCYICRSNYFMHAIETDIDEHVIDHVGNWDEEEGTLFRIFLNCEEFGISTFVGRCHKGNCAFKDIAQEFQNLGATSTQGAEGWNDIQKRIDKNEVPDVLTGKNRDNYTGKMKMVTDANGKQTTLIKLAEGGGCPG